MKITERKAIDFGNCPSFWLFLLTAGAAVFYTVQCSLLQNVLGLDIIETVVWGEQGVWGHGKHPPLSGWIGYAASWLAGHDDWGLYLVAEVCVAAGVWYTYRLARLFWDEYRSTVAAALLMFLFYYNPSEIKFSTYFVEIALRPAILFYFFRALRDGRTADWLAAGMCCGLGVLNKYSIGLLFVPLAAVALARREYREGIRWWKAAAAALTAAVVVYPHLIWLIHNDFACFRHVGGRMKEEHDNWQSLAVLGLAFYPLASSAAVLLAASLADWKKRVCVKPQWKIFTDAAIITLFPGAVFLAISLCGGGVITMWFCTAASLAGVAAVAAWPLEINRKTCNAVLIMLAVYTAGAGIATTCDLMFSSRPKLHTDPDKIVEAALGYWRKHRGDEPVPVVVGGLWLAGVVGNYTSYRPPVCEIEDDVFFNRYRDIIDEKGALVIGSDESEFTDFEERVKMKLAPEHHTVQYKAVKGKVRNLNFILGYYPSAAERRAASELPPRN